MLLKVNNYKHFTVRNFEVISDRFNIESVGYIIDSFIPKKKLIIIPVIIVFIFLKLKTKIPDSRGIVM